MVYMKKSHIVLIFAALCLALGLSACDKKPTPSHSASPSPSPSAAASPIPTEQVSGFLKTALEKLGSSCTISGTTVKLTQNVGLPDDVGLLLDAGGNYTLDFNGHTITTRVTKAGGSVISCTNGNLTLMDSVGGGGIAVTSGVEAYAVSCAYEGHMNITGMTVNAALSGAEYKGIAKNPTGAYALLAKEGGTLAVTGGSFSGNEGLIVEYVRKKPAVTLSGGTFSSFIDLTAGTDIGLFLGSGKKAVKYANGSITIS